MDEGVFATDWLPRWCADLSATLAELVATFEDRFGYPPGVNRVRPTDLQDRVFADELGRDMLTSASVAAFYQVVGEVEMPDIGNGYFLHPARDVLRTYQAEGAVFIPNAHDPHGMVIGSDGGGILFVADWGGAIHRSRAASVDSGFDQVADALPDFLDLLLQSAIRFAATGEPGYV